MSDRFSLLDRIGQGSYGAVHKALDKATGNVVAVKIVPMSSDAEELSKLVNEVEILKDCRHDNITSFLLAQVQSTDLWIAMEFCGGGSALSVMKALKGPYSEDIIAYILRETLRGLAYLHETNRMHRDIKAANILFTEDGRVKLADFGVSAQLSDKFSLRKTCIGSPYWMAPEVLMAQTTGQAYGVKADVWSLGITAIELAQLKAPLDHLHPMRAMYEIPNSKPPRLKDDKKWSKKFHDFVADALVKSPADRPAASDLLKHPFFEAHKSVSTAAMASVLEIAQAAKLASRQRLIAKYGVSDQSVSTPFSVEQSLAVAPPPPPKALASQADAVIAAAHTDTLRSAAEPSEAAAKRANEDNTGTIKVVAAAPVAAAATAATGTTPLKPRSDIFYGTIRKDTLDRLVGLSDFLEELVDESELPSAVSFQEMLDMDVMDLKEEERPSLSGQLRAGGPVPDSGKKLFSVIELAFAPFEATFADIWGRYVLLASDRGLYATVAGSTAPPKALLKGVALKRIDVLEQYGVLIALGGKSNSVRVYDLALLRKIIEHLFQGDGAGSTASKIETENYVKQLDATCEKLPNTRSTDEYRLTRLDSAIYLTVMGRKQMIVFCWAPHPFNRFMEVTSLSFAVSGAMLIGLVTGINRLKSYLIQIKEDLYLIDFHTSEMSLVDLKAAFHDNSTLRRESFDVASLLEIGEERAPPLAVLSAIGGAFAAAPGLATMRALPTSSASDRRGSAAASMASLSTFVDQVKTGAAERGPRVALIYGDLNADAMLLTVEDKTKLVGAGGEPKTDLVIWWSNAPAATVCRAGRYVAAFEDTLIEVRSATTGEPIQSLFSSQLRLRLLKQTPSGLAVLVLGIPSDKKRGCVLYSLAHDG